jgi:hypothetical protein
MLARANLLVAAQQEQRARAEQPGKGDLSDDKDRAQPAGVAASRDPVLRRRDGVVPERRQQARGEDRRHGDSNGEKSALGSERDLMSPREVGGEQLSQQRQTGAGEKETEYAADDADDEVLCEADSYELPPVGAERAPQ